MKTKDLEKYNWDTEFDQANKTMTHTFSDRVKVVVHWAFSTITLFKDNEIINKYFFESDYTLKQYEQFLLNISHSTQQLKDIEL